METLGQKQERFARALGNLLKYAEYEGIAVRMGECYRSPQEAARLAAEGKGIRKSLHTLRLAVDLIVAQDGKVIWDGWQYAVLGKKWKSYGDDYVWGGDWRNRDVYHFSIAHGGRK